MTDRSSDVPSTGLTYHLSLLHAKVDEVAERAGVSPSARHDLETCLAALPWRERRHLALILESVQVHADSPALQDAIHMMLKLTADVWAKEPPPDQGRIQPRYYAAH